MIHENDNIYLFDFYDFTSQQTILAILTTNSTKKTKIYQFDS